MSTTSSAPKKRFWVKSRVIVGIIGAFVVVAMLFATGVIPNPLVGLNRSASSSQANLSGKQAADKAAAATKIAAEKKAAASKLAADKAAAATKIAAEKKAAASKLAADKAAAAKAKIVAAAQVVAAKNVDNTLTKLGYGAHKGWKTTMTAADWAKVAMNNPGYMVQGTSFAKTPQEAAAAAVNNSAVAGTQAQKADHANWKLVYNDQCMVYPSMAYQDQNGNILWGNDFVECGVAMWVNVASGGSFRLLCDNATKVAPVATPLPPSLPQVKPNPAVVPPVVHQPKPPVKVTPPPTTVVQKYMYVCVIGSGDKTLQEVSGDYDHSKYTTNTTLCEKKVVVNYVCVIGSGDKTLQEVSGDYDHSKYTTDTTLCEKKVVVNYVCVIGSGNQTLEPIDKTIVEANPKIYTTDTDLCATPPCGCVPPPVQRCDTGVTPWAYVTISQEVAKDTNRYKNIPAKDCVKPAPPVCDQSQHQKKHPTDVWDEAKCEYVPCPPPVVCKTGTTPNPNNPKECLNQKPADGNFHGKTGTNPAKTDNPKATDPGLPATNTETGGGRGGAVDTSATNTNPTTDPGTKAPGATAPNKTPVTQVNEGGATDANGTNSGAVKSNPIDAPTVAPPAAPAPVDDSAAKAAAQAVADQAAKDAADVAALAAARAQAQAAANQAAQAAPAPAPVAVAAPAPAPAPVAAAPAPAVAALAAPAAAPVAAAPAHNTAQLPVPTPGASASTAGTTAAGAPVMAAVTAPANNG